LIYIINLDLQNLLTEETSKYLSGFVIPKLNTPEELDYIISEISKLEEKLKITENNKLKLVVWIESPLGLVNMREIFKMNQKHGRIIGAAFGAEDYCNDFGIHRSESLKEVEIARSIFALTAHAYNILAFDTPNVEFRNPESIIKEIEYVKTLGFKGKFAIHPSQVEIINKFFSHSENQLKEAMKIVEEFEKGVKNGKGAIEIEGKMVDYPVYKRALSIIERAKL